MTTFIGQESPVSFSLNESMMFAVQVDKAEITVYTKIWRVSGIDFLNLLGGGLGLCLGFSLISTLFYLFDTCNKNMLKGMKNL